MRTITQQDPTVIRVSGEIDLSTVSGLSDDLHRAVLTGCTHLLVDLTAVTFMGAALVNALVAGRNACRDRGGSLYITLSSANAWRLLTVTGLTSLQQPAVPRTRRPGPGS
jgi:anti-anti-sigma factor